MSSPDVPRLPEGWRLELLGGARLLGPGGPVRLDRRTAGLFVYLALEGATEKSRLAGLLWPESPEATARSNLRQLLHRLRSSVGAELIVGAGQLELAVGLEVDVVRLRSHARKDTHAVVAELTGELLAGLEFDDAEDFSQWLRGAREELDGLRHAAAMAEALRREEAGNFPAAIEYARRALELQPLSEEVHRRLMRLHYLAGDRGAALAAYERCRMALSTGLGVEPLPETVALAREIARGAQAPRSPASQHIPLSVLRPPVLAGREREWALMEAAWEAGQAIFISGEPGVGKTRLMQDFLAAKGRALCFMARPGDRVVPYGTHSRTYRELLELLQREGSPPEPWVVRELARIIPGLGEPPGPIRDEVDMLRFYQAKIEMHRTAIARGYTLQGFDDLQCVDDVSAQSGYYILSQLMTDAPSPLRSIHCYRAGELPPMIASMVSEGVAMGQVLHLELKPLDMSGVEELLSSLGLPWVSSITEQVARYTAGNPLFVLETVKHLIETGAVAQGLPEHLPPPGKVGPVITSRLHRLSVKALHLARTLAVLGENFSLELAGQLLECGLQELIAQWTELETAQIVRGSGFSHDLIGERVEATMPPLVKTLLHRRAAEVLEAQGGNPIRVAEHWRQAGEPGRVAPTLLRAAEWSRLHHLPQEAAGFYTQAAEAFEAQGDAQGAEEARVARSRIMGR